MAKRCPICEDTYNPARMRTCQYCGRQVCDICLSVDYDSACDECILEGLSLLAAKNKRKKR